MAALVAGPVAGAASDGGPVALRAARSVGHTGRPGCAASAAYPLLLPALDERYTFRRRDRSLVADRVTLSDGGVYDNLGLSPLWPDRDWGLSVVVDEVDTIVACRAGYGQRMGNPGPFVAGRMKAAFGCVFNRTQNAATSRLFDLKASPPAASRPSSAPESRRVQLGALCRQRHDGDVGGNPQPPRICHPAWSSSSTA